MDSEYYEDAWGSFYSAYSPVFASDGTVGGIIAVDFSKEWYDEQMSALTNTVLIVNTLSFMLTAVMLVFLINGEKRRRAIADRLAATADIYISMYEVNLVNNTFTEVYNHKGIAATGGGGTKPDAARLIKDIYSKFCDPTTKDRMLDFVDMTTLSERLATEETITNEFLTVHGKWSRARFIALERATTGAVTRAIYLVEDIDKEKRERDKLVDMSQRAIAASEAKSSFLSNMSHEIRTPVNAVLGMNEMILRECGDDNILAYSNSIRTAGTTLLGLVNDILDFSKIEAGKMEIIPVDYDLSSMINDLVNMIQR